MSEKKEPIFVDLKEGQVYSWCACGLSDKQPFCDGSHKDKSDLKSLKFTVEKDTKAALCTCKNTKNPPYCDGSHTEN